MFHHHNFLAPILLAMSCWVSSAATACTPAETPVKIESCDVSQSNNTHEVSGISEADLPPVDLTPADIFARGVSWLLQVYLEELAEQEFTDPYWHLTDQDFWSQTLQVSLSNDAVLGEFIVEWQLVYSLLRNWKGEECKGDPAASQREAIQFSQALQAEAHDAIKINTKFVKAIWHKLGPVGKTTPYKENKKREQARSPVMDKPVSYYWEDLRD